tara:strand:+ start:106 stop:1101 length:996 start_codon:yes stop_codon:yes gene_type:complete
LDIKRIVIENQVDRKKQIDFNKHIDGCNKLDYFFNKLVEYRESYRRYPTINKWREFVVTSLLENLSKNKKLKFDMVGISSNKKLKENICRYQKNKVDLYDFCFSCALDFYEKNGITINSLSMEICYEMIFENSYFGFDIFYLPSQIERNIFEALSRVNDSNGFENSIGQNSILNELETELYRTIDYFEYIEYNNLFSLDRVLLQLSYKISPINVEHNINSLKKIITKEQTFLSQRFNYKNTIAKKYDEISKMILSILNSKEKELINLRYGLDNERRYTLIDIYKIKQYKNYKSLFEDLIRALWKLRICWPNEIIYKLLFCCDERNEEESLF